MDIGNAMFRGVVPPPQPTQKVTNLSAHVDGGPGVSGGGAGNAVASYDERACLWTAAAIVLVALAALWFMGAFAFRGIRL